MSITSKKVVEYKSQFLESVQKQLNKKIKTDFPGKSTFFELPITQKLHFWGKLHGKRQKSCFNCFLGHFIESF